MKMELTEGSEKSAYIIQTLGNRPKERVQHSEHSESRNQDLSDYLASVVDERMRMEQIRSDKDRGK